MGPREAVAAFNQQNFFQNKKTLFKLLFIAGLLVSLVIGVVLVRREQIFKSRAAGGGAVNQVAVGYDVTGIIHYGYLLPTGQADLYPFSRADAPGLALKEIQRLGGKVIRVFAANSNISDEEAARRLDEFLTLADNYNIQVIVSLTNLYRDDNGVGQYPQAARPYFKVMDNQWGHLIILNSEFFQSGYKTSYLPYVTTMVSRNKYHSNIYAWEIGNELRDEGNPDPQPFIAFMQDTIQTIKSIDSRHAVSSGMMGVMYSYPNLAGNPPDPAAAADKFYSQLSDLDIISIIDYNNDHRGEPDVTWAVSHGKRAIVSELGFDTTTASSQDRSSFYKEGMEYWKNRGAEAVLIWGFLPKQLRGDNGNGDSRLGMDAIWHKDYDKIAEVLMTANRPPVPTPTPAPTPTPIPSPVASFAPASLAPAPSKKPELPSPPVSRPQMTCEYSEVSSDCASGFQIVTGTGCDGFNCTDSNGYGCRFVDGISTVRCSDASAPAAPAAGPAAPAPQPASQPSSSCPAMTCDYSEVAPQCPSGFQIVTGTGCDGFNCEGCTYVGGGCSGVTCSN